MPFQPGQSGNPKGKAKGAISKLSVEAREVMAQKSYNPIDRTITLAKKAEGHLATIEAREQLIIAALRLDDPAALAEMQLQGTDGTMREDDDPVTYRNRVMWTRLLKLGEEKLSYMQLLMTLYAKSAPYAYPQLKAIEYTQLPQKEVRTPEERKARIAALLAQMQSMALQEGVEPAQPQAEA
jgi:hypothetical protein